jgi:hypothetical protein
MFFILRDGSSSEANVTDAGVYAAVRGAREPPMRSRIFALGHERRINGFELAYLVPASAFELRARFHAFSGRRSLSLGRRREG